MKGYHDIVGDGGSGIVDQVVRQKDRIAGRLSGVRAIVAIASGKGGVGKSTVTHALGCALVERGLSVAILDADLNGPCQARLAGLEAAPPIPAREGLAVRRAASGLGVVSLGSMIEDGEPLEFASVAPGDSFVWRSTREFTALGDLLGGVAWGRLDFLLVDLPPGAERTVQYAEFFGDRAAFVLVTTPSDLSRGVVARSLAALERRKARLLGVVTNMVGYRCPDCGEVKPLFPDAGNGPLPGRALGSVPFDPKLGAPGVGASLPFRDLAARLVESLPELSAGEEAR